MQFAVIYRPLLSLFCLFVILSPSLAQAFSSSECIITMGYRTSERRPFIEQEPSNQGFYRDIYQAAAEKIGCKLRVVRAPKLRILRDLKLGNVDFYPGLHFSEERAQFAYFIPNGLSERYIGISRAGAASINSLAQLSQTGMTLLIAPGSYDFNGISKTMSVRKPPELDVPKALDYLLASQGDFFIYDLATLNYYLKNRDISQFQLHPDCCQQPQAMYLGFSKKSRHFRALQNPYYRANLPLSPDNIPSVLAEDSKAYEFARALAIMDAEGETQRIYFNYFG